MTEMKVNFKNKYFDEICPLCWLEEDSQTHLMECQILKNNCEALKENSNVQYGDIFGKISKQKNAIQLLEKIWNTRESLLKKNSA